MFLPIVLLVLAAIFALWTLAAVGSLFLALLSLIPSAIVGLLAGWLASRLVGARLGTGWTILAGIAGSWLGSALFSVLFHVRSVGLLNPVHFVASVLGAAILITFARAVARPSLTGDYRPRLGRTY